MSKPVFFKTAAVLGLLSAIGPVAIDMYLPAMPAIGQALGAGMSSVQLSLIAFFLALGAGQLLYGPISDRVGRKPPLYAGLIIFALASVGCALATSVTALVAFRFLQGFGAAAGAAIPRAVVRDLHTGPDAARLMALLMLVFSVSPILAPLAGSAVMQLAGWRVVFWVVAVAAIVGIVMMATLLAETLPPFHRTRSTFRSAMSAYGRLLGDRDYVGWVLIGGFTIAIFFIFLAGSSFVIINHFGLSTHQYSVAFGINAAAFIGAAQLTGPLSQRYGLIRLVRAGVALSAMAMVAMCMHFAAGGNSLWVLMTLYFIATCAAGMIVPATGVLALDSHGSIAGTASALMGTLQMLTGALAIAVTGAFSNGEPLPMVVGMAASALAAALLAKFVHRPGRRRRPCKTAAE